MPIFEQSCKDCKKVYEILSKYDERLSQICPDCNSPTDHLVSAPGCYEIKGNNSGSVPSKWSKKRPKA